MRGESTMRQRGVLLALGRLAVRDLRSGVAGLRLPLVSLALGVAAIAAVGVLTVALRGGLADEGRLLLGGDVEVAISNRAVTAEERAWLTDHGGAVSQITTLRAMARLPGGAGQQLVSLRAVDAAYPLVGALRLADPEPGDWRARLGERDGRWGAIAAPGLINALGVDVGETLRLGDIRVTVRGVLDDEPDALSGGFQLGPRLLIDRRALSETGLIQRGSLRTHRFRLLLPEAENPADLEAWATAARTAFPEASWQIRNRANAAPGLEALIERLGLLLSLVGLSALAVGGIGVANGVRTHLEGRRRTLATLKAVGARGWQVLTLFGVQLTLLAGLATLLGLTLGALAPSAWSLFLSERFPIPVSPIPALGPLLLAAGFGLVITALFAVAPLASAQRIPPALLFRATSEAVLPPPGRATGGVVLVLLLGLVALVAVATPDPVFALASLGGLAVLFGALVLAAEALVRGLRVGLRRYPLPRRPMLRLATANLTRPGAPTRSVVLSLGLGLTLITTVALVGGGLGDRLQRQMPAEAPTFFVIDIRKDQRSAFEAMVTGSPGFERWAIVPHLRARIVAIDGVPVGEAEVAEGGRWALRGDRGLTYAADQPEEERVVAGSWWPADYSGSPRLSMGRELAQEFGVSLGDTLTFNVLGRRLEAEIVNLRVLDWQSLGINFLFMLSPQPLAAAPHGYLATVAVTDEAANDLESRLTEAFPNISVVRVQEAVAAVNRLFASITSAVYWASGLTVLVGTLVLVSAFASGYRRRRYEGAVLLAVGTSRGRLFGILALEYLLLGVFAGTIALALALPTAALILTQALEIPPILPLKPIVASLVGAVGVTLMAGLVTTWRGLGRSPAHWLRNP